MGEHLDDVAEPWHRPAGVAATARLPRTRGHTPRAAFGEQRGLGRKVPVQPTRWTPGTGGTATTLAREPDLAHHVAGRDQDALPVGGHAASIRAVRR